MKQRPIDLSEGILIDLGSGTAFATTGCTGELLFGGFDLADLKAELSGDIQESKNRKKKESKNG
jgi:hypothetical protein|tara:strand:- start:126 stop:317 length:192 start_codon:yes stop_codon:yes gene_type:complete